MVRETGVQSQVESYQRLKTWYLMPPYLTLSIIWYGSRVSRAVQGNQGSIPGRIILKTQKMVLDASLLNTQHYKVHIMGKRSKPGKGAIPSLAALV